MATRALMTTLEWQNNIVLKFNILLSPPENLSLFRFSLFNQTYIITLTCFSQVNNLNFTNENVKQPITRSEEITIFPFLIRTLLIGCSLILMYAVSAPFTFDICFNEDDNDPLGVIFLHNIFYQKLVCSTFLTFSYPIELILPLYYRIM